MNKTAAAIILSALSASAALADTTFNYGDLSSTAGLIIQKDARATSSDLDGPVIRLTPSWFNRSGVVTAADRVAVNNFSTQFTFRVTDIHGITDLDQRAGSDGFYLSLGSSNTLTPGYLPVLNNAGLVIHFDTFRNNGDPSSNFISASVNGQRVATANYAAPFDNGQLWYAWVDFDGTDLRVYTAREETRPTNPSLTLRGLNLTGILGGDTAFAAIGAKGEGGYANQDLVSWRFQPIPTPGAAAVLGMGGLLAARRRRS